MAAFTPDWQHDLFISYGRVDDSPGDNGERGWVSRFVDDLKARLSQRLGRKDTFSVWRDEQDLAADIDLEKQIANAVQNSACMLVIMSPAYCASSWCKTERSSFLKWLNDRKESGGRIFVIDRDPLGAGDRKPPEFNNLRGYQFWTGDPMDEANLPRPLDKDLELDVAKYKAGINRVAVGIETALREIVERSRQKTVEPDLIVCKTAATIFLAEVTDDLWPQWNKVRTEFDQQGLRVVSGGTPRDIATTESTVAAALKESQLFVQLLSQVAGRPLSDADETYACLQNRLAHESGIRILQWRSPQLTEEVFDQQGIEDPRHRALIFGCVRAEHIEDFKRYVVEVATASRPPKQPQTDRGMIFVNYKADGDDTKLAQDLCDYLDLKGFGVITPVDDSDDNPEEIRADFEKNVLSSRSWIVVYGDNRSKLWVRRRLNEINQLLCEHSQSGSIHLCAGPPAPKEVTSPLRLVGFKLPRMSVIDCQEGFDGERLTEFLQAMNLAEKGVGSPAVPREAVQSV
jgi:TIR domain